MLWQISVYHHPHLLCDRFVRVPWTVVACTAVMQPIKEKSKSAVFNKYCRKRRSLVSEFIGDYDYTHIGGVYDWSSVAQRKIHSSMTLNSFTF